MVRNEPSNRADQACADFECGLARDNAQNASKLIAEGKAILKISVYPWGLEFDVVPNGDSLQVIGGESKGGV